MADNLLPVVEAAYELGEDDNAWLTRLCEASRPLLDRGLGIAAMRYDATRDDYVDLAAMGGIDVEPKILDSMFGGIELEPEEQRQLVQIFRARGASTMWRALRALPGFEREVKRRLAAVGFPQADFFGVIASDPSCQGVVLTAFGNRPIHPHPRTIARWSRAAAHIATGWRVRERLRALRSVLLTESPEAEAVLEPGGRLSHATGEATPADARERLRAAVVAFEKARLASTDPDEALALWEALIEGRWSLLDCFDHDGRHYWVAHRNEPNVPSIPALSERERQVAAYAALGQSNKLIAYELGVSIASVARDLRSARAKLGLSSRIELVRAVQADPGLTRVEPP